jgi:hypothetical protein
MRDYCTVAARDDPALRCANREGVYPGAVRRNGEKGRPPARNAYITQALCALLDTIPTRGRVSPCSRLPRRHNVTQIRGTCSRHGYIGGSNGYQDRPLREDHGVDDNGERAGTNAGTPPAVNTRRCLTESLQVIRSLRIDERDGPGR